MKVTLIIRWSLREEQLRSDDSHSSAKQKQNKTHTHTQKKKKKTRMGVRADVLSFDIRQSHKELIVREPFQ